MNSLCRTKQTDGSHTRKSFSTTFNVSVATFRGGKDPPIAEATLSARIKLSIHVPAPIRNTSESPRPSVTEGLALNLTAINLVNFGRGIMMG